MEIVDIDRLFEEYVETDMFQLDGDSKTNKSALCRPIGFLKTAFSNESDIFTIESILDRDAESAWHKALPKCEQIPDLALPDDSSQISIDLEGTDLPIDSELSRFNNLFERERDRLHPLSQPSTPRVRPARSIKKSLSFNDRPFLYQCQQPSWKSLVVTAKRMKQPSHYRANNHPANTKSSTESFHIPASSNGMISPYLPLEIDQTGNGCGSFSQNHQPYATVYPSFHDNNFLVKDANYLNTSQPMSRAPRAIETSRNSRSFSSENLGMAYSASESSAALSALHTPPSSLSLPARWGFDTSQKSNFAFSASSTFPGAVPMADSWNGDPARHYPYCESNSQGTCQGTGHANEGLNGLSVSCEVTPFDGFDLTGMMVDVGEEVRGASASSFETDSLSASQPTLHQQQTIPLGRSRLSRSPSPFPQPNFHRRRSSSYARSSHRHRRKSSNPSLVQWRQSDSDNMGFVNYTPDDSKKILTGVAPSGSSKTKARREKEAADKRRRLSQAAVKAVIKAGGDIDSLKDLESEGLFVLGN